MKINKIMRAAVLNLRNMTTRPQGAAGGRFTESRQRTPNGIEYDLYTPSKTSRNTFIVVHGLTLQGERDHRLVNFSRALAEGGIRAAAIALPALKSCRFDEEDTEAIIDLGCELNSSLGGRVGIVGFSMGAGIALTAAANPRVSRILDPLLLFGPHYSLDDVWASLWQRSRKQPSADKEWDDYIWLRTVLAYREMDSLKLSDSDKSELTGFLYSYCFENSLQKKLQFYDRLLKGLNIDARGIAPSNGIPGNVSPKGKLSAITGRVLILHDEFDGLIPPEQSRKIMDELSLNNGSGPHKLLITPLLSHVTAGSAGRFLDIFRILRIMGELFP